jgi:hypothetical protein
MGVDNVAELVAASPSELLGPPPSRVKYADYLDNIVSDSIWNDVGRVGHNQFTGADYSARAADRGMPRESRYCGFDRRDHSSCGCRAVLRNVFGLSVEIGSRFAKPLNAHGASTS